MRIATIAAIAMCAAVGLDTRATRDEMPPPPRPPPDDEPEETEEESDPIARAAARFHSVDDLNRTVRRVEAAIGKRERKAARRRALAARSK